MPLWKYNLNRLCGLALVGLAITLFAPKTAFADSDEQSLLERGTYLMNSIVACGNCHTLRGTDGRQIDGMELAGGFVIEEAMFTAVVPNITPDVATGVGGRSDDELIRAIREGIRPDGTVIGPIMAFGFYRNLSDTDARAIVAYIRSVPAVSNATGASEYKFMLPPAYGPPVGSVPDPDRSDKVAYGAYLAGPAGHCLECHTPFNPAVMRPDYENRLGAGGFQFTGPGGAIVVSANITPDMETGIGGWTDDEIKNAITQGVRPDGARLNPPMAFDYYARMNAEDVGALIAYLRSMKPIKNAVR